MQQYVEALESAGYSEDEILEDLQTELKRLVYNLPSWTSWRNAVERWIEDLNGKE